MAVVGDYRIDITLKDESYEVPYKLDVIIKENTAPYFDSLEVGHIDGSMKEGSLINIFALNPMIDDQGDEISVEIEFGEIESFASFDPHANIIILNLD